MRNWSDQQLPQSSNKQGVGCDISGTLTHWANRDKWVLEISVSVCKAWETIVLAGMLLIIQMQWVLTLLLECHILVYISLLNMEGKKEGREYFRIGERKGKRNWWWNNALDYGRWLDVTDTGFLPIPSSVKWPSSVRLLVREASGSLLNYNHPHVQFVSGHIPRPESTQRTWLLSKCIKWDPKRWMWQQF